jgi:hypothetical protein
MNSVTLVRRTSDTASLPISMEAPCHKNISFFKIMKFQKFKNSIIFWPFFWVPFWLPGLFLKIFCGLTTDLYPDVSTTFPASFFTVMHKDLTTGKRTGWTIPGQILLMTLAELHFHSAKTKKSIDKKSCTLELMVTRKARNRIIRPPNCRICVHR